jgi:HemX protein
MDTISKLLNDLLPFCYLVVFYLYYKIFIHKNRHLEKYTLIVLLALLFVHIFIIVLRINALKMMPLLNKHDAMSFMAFSIVLVYFFIELTIKNKASGLFILGFAFIVDTISSLMYNEPNYINPLLTDPTFAVHASLTITGYTALSLSALYSLMYIIQYGNMKNRKFDIFYDQLPALSYLENMSIRAIAIGIGMLLVGVFLGHIQAHKVLSTYLPTDFKVLVTDIILIVYFFAYVLSRIFKWRGRYMAYLSLAGFLLIVVSGLLIIFLTQSFHNFS